MDGKLFSQMRWFVFGINVIAAVAFLGLAEFAVTAHRTHAYSTLREFESRQVIGVPPEGYNVLAKMQQIGGGGSYYRIIGGLAATACFLNGLFGLMGYRSRDRGLAREEELRDRRLESR
ncbi:MAG: hypothetical protein ACKVHO_17470 [Verrucomicrobiia bacterium]